MGNSKSLPVKNSDLRLEHSLLNESIFKINSKIDFSNWYSVEENELQVTVNSKLAVHRFNPNEARLILSIELFDENFEEEEFPFHCFVKMSFMYKDRAGEYTDDSDVTDKLGLNMISMAYPYLRAYIYTLSSISGIEQIHLPAINVFNTFADKSKEDPSES
ncbi:hypothetical protein [Enterococcus sp. AZ007]|uniref:hypothetical protein n=1 Tax=Enterococcus sp. AZ007 TaxID=2774839 RepID=UPI003F25070F